MDVNLLKLNKDVYGGQKNTCETAKIANTDKEMILWLMWKSVVFRHGQIDGSSPGAVFNLAAVWLMHLYALIRSKMLPPPFDFLWDPHSPFSWEKKRRKICRLLIPPFPHPAYSTSMHGVKRYPFPKPSLCVGFTHSMTMQEFLLPSLVPSVEMHMESRLRRQTRPPAELQPGD